MNNSAHASHTANLLEVLSNMFSLHNDDKVDFYEKKETYRKNYANFLHVFAKDINFVRH